MSQIIPTAEPFFFPGKGAKAKIGCLVTHGFHRGTERNALAGRIPEPSRATPFAESD